MIALLYIKVVLYSFFWHTRHGYENGVLARSLKLVLIKKIKQNGFLQFCKTCVLFFSTLFPMRSCSAKCVAKIVFFVSIKLLIFLRFGRNIYQASIDRQKKMKAEKVAVVE